METFIQKSIFTDEMGSRRLLMPDAEVIYYPTFFNVGESDAFLEDLSQDTVWEQPTFNFSGKKVLAPRLIAWYGHANKSYAYSGIQHVTRNWTPTLVLIKERVEQVAGVSFNGVLLNFYRDGADSISWHSDDEAQMGENPIIASVSFGETRSFLFKHKQRPNLQTRLDLTHGSLLLMGGPTQQFWKHSIPKTTAAIGPRINLTFRTIVK